MERSRILRRAADLLRERNDELAWLETLDTGKPLSETEAVGVVTGADALEYYAGLAPAVQCEQIPLSDTAFVYTRREPLGVCAGIGAWNYPLQIACWKSAPALACGNAMVFKPSEVTPLSIPKPAEIFTEAGLPVGVFDVVRRANATPYALAAGVFSESLRRARRVIHRLQAGICWLNSYNLSPVVMPVGGYKQSGIGRENGLSTLAPYTQIKSIYVELGDVECPYA
jgi:acyl-CoA reductase-like NAD-dependent aldehyde dehydrogenase